MCVALYGGLFDQQMKGKPPLSNILRLDKGRNSMAINLLGPFLVHLFCPFFEVAH